MNMRKMLLTAVVAAVAVGPWVGAAHATMPNLGPMPSVRTPSACHAWADKQLIIDEDNESMWGMKEDGSSSRTFAIRRLTDHCLGKPTPAIVGVGSSIGYALSYCKRHPSAKLCDEVRRSQ
jgi:hypothetical protein